MLFPFFVPQGRSKTRYKAGYINELGQTVIDPIFDEASYFHENKAAVKVHGKWGVIGLGGQFIIPPKLWNWCKFSEGLASLATRAGKYGLIDESGEFVVAPKYDYVGPLDEGLALVRTGESRDMRFGFIDRMGNEVIPAQFKGANRFSEGLAAVKFGELWGYTDQTGSLKIPPLFASLRSGPHILARASPGYFKGGLAPVWSSTGGYRFINTVGDFAFEGLYEEARSFSEGRAMIQQGNKFGFIDCAGQLIVPCRFTHALGFSEGLARVREGRNQLGVMSPCGFIETNGEMAITPIFYSAESFNGGLSLVTTDKTIGYINKLEEFVWEGSYVDYGIPC